MCTVTFVPVKGGALIASNRDEKNMRKPALPPAMYAHGTTNIMYPKDAQAGGTWIALKHNGDAAVLLNGAFTKHTAQPPYTQSRGLVLLEIFKQERPVQAFLHVPLNNIEPFTLILFIGRVLTECRWDGQEKHVKYLPASSAHIWSSATLYSHNIVAKREGWFNSWLAEHKDATIDELVNFHRFAGDGDKQNSLLMQRENVYQTVSITALALLPGREKMIYHDLVHNTSITQPITMTPVSEALYR